jgi:exodeoxyribonuclease VII large subunit
VTLFPTPVQGAGAGQQIAAAIARANTLGATLDPPLEVLIVGRGGGSLEDLWAFNEEQVASAIYHSKLPIVSAVGHEIDFSIADLVADCRAATPSAAAELLSPDQHQLRQRIAQQHQRLALAMTKLIARQRQQLDLTHKRLKHPGTRLQEYSLRLDESELRLTRAVDRLLRARQGQLQQMRQRLVSLAPWQRLERQRERVNHLQQQLQQRWHAQLQARRHRLTRNAELLHSVSPLQTLQRGYAIVAAADGSIVRSAKQVRRDDEIHIRLGDGEIDARIL